MNKALDALGLWISPFYGPFSLGVRFETYEPFICLTHCGAVTQICVICVFAL
jgi:hypothetical protein